MDDYMNEPGFSYTYCAKQQEEIKNIRRKYMSAEEDKMEQLRRLDRSTEKRGTTVSLAVGMGGVMLLGLGMCCTMVWSGLLFVPGIVIGLAGIFLMTLAYPLYKKITEKERRKIAPEILRLTEELMK